MKPNSSITHPLQGMPNLTEIIERSLKRSIKYGVDPNTDGAPESSSLSHEELKQRIENESDFFSVAQSELDSLCRLLRNTGFCAAVADHDGYVLYTAGDAELMAHFNRRRCKPGYRWTEQDMGTCAIGIALEEKMPIFLPGDRMFASLAQWISNAGAPVFSPDGGTLLGVLCLSGYSEKMHVHTLGLVRQSAERITAILREKEHTLELQIQNQYMKALLESKSRGMVTIDHNGCILQSNKKARTLLNIPSGDVGKKLEHFIGNKFNIKRYLTSGTSVSAKEIFSKQSGKSHFASLDPILTDMGAPVGGLITIIEKDEIMRMAVQLTGTQAHFTFNSIIGPSEKQKEALHLARISAGSTVSVLLSGETGTGKELFAQAIHNESDRSNQPFVALNCGAIPNELFESELFGYEEGAFTGAQRGGRPGKLELAHNGTLFLDEIGDMPYDMQVKLLRVLQSGELTRVGGIRSMSVNLRIISATNINLKEAIVEKKFRSDLYYRICTLKIRPPPLRERPEDLMPLTHHFIKRHEVQLGRSIALQMPDTEQAIKNYHWPGNVRQLENGVERAVHLSEGGVLRPTHFGISYGEKPLDAIALSASTRGLTLAEVEKRVLIDTMEELGGNIRKVATQLAISRPTIYRKLKKYGIQSD